MALAPTKSCGSDSGSPALVYSTPTRWKTTSRLVMFVRCGKQTSYRRKTQNIVKHFVARLCRKNTMMSANYNEKCRRNTMSMPKQNLQKVRVRGIGSRESRSKNKRQSPSASMSKQPYQCARYTFGETKGGVFKQRQ